MITIIIHYKGKNGNARKFAKEMIESKLVDEIRKENGNLRYEYYYPLEDNEAVVLIDSWVNQEALDIHHSLPLMSKISKLRDKYDLHMKVEKYEEINDDKDKAFIRK